jgi:hypothetical protein
MTGTAVGQMAGAVRFTTTTMFMCPIRRSRHAATATIQPDLRLQTVRGESVGQVESAGRAESAGRVELAGRVESVAQGVLADPAEPVDQVELVGQAVPAVQVESAGLGELAGILDLALSAERVHPTGRRDHLLGHTTQPPRRSTRQTIRT